MTRVDVRCEHGEIHFRCQSLGVDDSRPADDQLRSLLDAWTQDYRQALGKPDAPQRILALGRKLHDWLDGDARCLERIRETDPPLVVCQPAY